MPHHLYVLFEHAAGYALFKSMKYDDPASFAQTVKENAVDLENFKQIVTFIAFKAFKNSRNALENMNKVSEGIVHPELHTFLSGVEFKKKSKIGIADPKLGSSLAELGYDCESEIVVAELIRGIRLHFYDLVIGFEDPAAATKAQLGLGHYYSRNCVKYNVKRTDNMIIQSINLLDQLDKDINTFVMRIREWYSLHFPELLQIVPENAMFIQCVNVVRNREQLGDIEEELENILNDPGKVEKIMRLARSSMGMNIEETDLENVHYFVDRVISMTTKRKEVLEYLKSKMHDVAPNLGVLLGEIVGARLISHSGSLTNLAKSPASTIQILGAEKALFRALKTRGNTPKYGLLYHSKFIAKARKEDKGRISRYLANKCSAACRIDCFRGDFVADIFGEKLKQQVEARLKFLESGEVPEKNVDIMANADEEAVNIEKALKKADKKAKKAKKLKQLEESTLSNGVEEDMNDSQINEVSSFSNGVEEDFNDSQSNLETPSSIKKKKKKKKHLEQSYEETETSIMDDSQQQLEETQGSIKKKKKKRKLEESFDQGQQNGMEEILNAEKTEEERKAERKAAKKKRKSMALNNDF